MRGVCEGASSPDGTIPVFHAAWCRRGAVAARHATRASLGKLAVAINSANSSALQEQRSAETLWCVPLELARPQPLSPARPPRLRVTPHPTHTHRMRNPTPYRHTLHTHTHTHFKVTHIHAHTHTNTNIPTHLKDGGLPAVVQRRRGVKPRTLHRRGSLRWCNRPLCGLAVDGAPRPHRVSRGPAAVAVG